MRKTIQSIIFILFFLSVSISSKAQMTNLIFFSEQGEHFSVVLNGILQNATPETNIKITDLPAPSYKLKIIFEDPKIRELNKTLMYQQGTETTFNIRKNRKGQYVLRFLNQVPIAETPPPPADQHVFMYTTVPATNITINQVNNTTMTVSQPTSASPSPANISINVGTEATTHSATASGEINHQNTFNPKKHPYEMPGYHGDIGCPYPMNDLDFRDVKNTIASKSFEESKLSIAKEVISSNCLFASEVKEIMDLFSFEATRLDFAKFAYSYTFDVGNYYKVNEAFKFESSIAELKNFLKEVRNK
jgi:hypothetical protein